MKTALHPRNLVCTLLAGLSLMLSGRATAQTFTNLHSFSLSEGFDPIGGLALGGNTLYGTTSSGDAAGGAIFKINVDGTGFGDMHAFDSEDGVNPGGTLVLDGDILYGTATAGGDHAEGSVFAIGTNGLGFTNLHSFTPLSGNYPYYNTEGATPEAGLIVADGVLYGTASAGGAVGLGTVFSLNTNGTAAKSVVFFANGSYGAYVWGGAG